MSIKVHFLFSYLDRFPDFLWDYSENQGERYQQDINIMEERYQGRLDGQMMVDYYRHPLNEMENCKVWKSLTVRVLCNKVLLLLSRKYCELFQVWTYSELIAMFWYNLRRYTNETLTNVA